MTQVDRRAFLRDSMKYAGGVALAPSLAGLAACNAPTDVNGVRPELRRAGRGTGGYGALQADPGGLPLLIPAGFTLKRVSRAGDVMESGALVPNAFDGMAAFAAPNGRVRLVRNHEIRDGARPGSAFGVQPYDPNAGAGCTTIELTVDPTTAEPTVAREFVSISGTFVNCAGGPTPWGSWLTCEETVAGPNNGFARKHGYNFEVPADRDGEGEPVALTAMGRFVHEAVAIDPRDGIAYETEDAGNSSGFYRFIPAEPGNLAAGGRLQMLVVKGRPNLNTTGVTVNGVASPLITPFAPMLAEWVDIDDADPDLEGFDGPAQPSVFAQGFAKGGARFARLEGCWWRDDSVFFNATSGGRAGAGQVWQYRPLTASTGQLVLVFESPSREVLDSPDNICVSPRGGLVICEDGGGTQFLRGLTRDGRIFDLVSSQGSASEFAGACYSPDGRILFFNTQGSTSSTSTNLGVTYALWGPWEQGVL